MLNSQQWQAVRAIEHWVDEDTVEFEPEELKQMRTYFPQQIMSKNTEGNTTKMTQEEGGGHLMMDRLSEMKKSRKWLYLDLVNPFGGYKHCYKSSFSL